MGSVEGTEATNGYIRFPAIHGDTIVVMYQDDLWSVPATGGRAARLTAGAAEFGHPHFSPDGARLAFVGMEEGPEEVYVMPSGGGDVTRVTYEGGHTTVVGWQSGGRSGDGDRIVFAGNARRAFPRDFRLYAVDPGDGIVEELPYGQARTISFGPDGGVVIARHMGGSIVHGRHNPEPSAFKRYRGGRTGTVWVDQSGAGAFERLLPDLGGNPAYPCWVGTRIYFLGDHEGIGNVYSCRPDGSDLRRHTDHADYYARNLSTDGTRLVYHCAGDLYLLDPAAGSSAAAERVEVDFGTTRSWRNRRFVPAADYLDDVRLGPDGTDLALLVRGKPFTMAHWEGSVRQHGEPDGVRYAHAAWSGDHRRLIAAARGEETDGYLMVSDADGEPGAGSTRVEGPDLGLAYELVPAPEGDRVAIANHRLEVLLLDLTDLDRPTVRVLDRPAEDEGARNESFDRPKDLAWSPDGRWLAWTRPGPLLASTVMVADTEGDDVVPATPGMFADDRPAWDPEGRYLYFLGRRDFDPVRDQLILGDWGFPQGCRPYAISLRADTGSPFVPRPRPVGPSHDARTGGQESAAESIGDADGRVRVEIDLPGLADRAQPFPVPHGRYDRIAGTRGKALFTSEPVSGALGADVLAPGSSGVRTLHVFDYRTQRTEQLAEGIDDFAVDSAGRTMLYRTGNRVRVLPAGEKPSGDGAASGGGANGAEQPGRSSGWIDLSRIKVSVSPAAEWRQIFTDAWRMQSEQFWSSDMAGVDWDEVYRRYAPLVDRVSTRAELADLIWEAHGELSTSHAYELGGDYRKGPKYRQGFLGIDWEFDRETGRFIVGSIVEGDRWRPTASSSLTRPGVDVRSGDVVVSIGGRPIGAAGDGSVRPAGEPLADLADAEVELTVVRDGSAPRTVTVRALADERPARYRDWVEASRSRVHERSDGRLGYLHVPDTHAPGLSEFHRGLSFEHVRDGLVVDFRFNGGGDPGAVWLMLEKLARRRLSYFVPRWGPPVGWPHPAVRGALVGITNEYAGSGGDMISHGFKVLGLGPLLGKRSWGGVVGTGGQDLVDDGVVTQPAFYAVMDDVGWRLENNGAVPDVEVEITPQDYASGVDPQLERAIDTALELLEKNPAHHPGSLPAPPRLTPPPLPPR